MSADEQRKLAAIMFTDMVGYSALSQRDEAIRWLEQSVTDAGPDNPYIRVHPFLDPLRGDPRFEALAEKIVPAAQFKSTTASK